MQITPDIETRADEIISHYPVSTRSAALPLLHLVQEEFGFISDDHANWIARKLGVEPVNILEVLTFYPMLRRHPAGKHHIRVCRTLSCAMAGGYQLLEKFCERTGIDRHQANGHGSHMLRSPDGRFSIEFVECLASCGTGPVCMINDDFHEAVPIDGVDALLKNYD